MRGLGDQCNSAPWVAGVPGHRHARDLRCHRLYGFGAPACDDHLRALAGEQTSNGGSDTRPTAGDERHLILEPNLDLLL